MSRIAGIWGGGQAAVFTCSPMPGKFPGMQQFHLGFFLFLRARGAELKARKRSGGNPETLGKTGNDTNVRAEAACVVFVHIV